MRIRYIYSYNNDRLDYGQVQLLLSKFTLLSKKRVVRRARRYEERKVMKFRNL